jgi:hypothetical protein
MTEPAEDKILDKLAKLMAMRDGAGTTQEEARAFAAHVKRLLDKHKLEEADVKDHDSGKKRVVDSTRVDLGEYGLPKKSYRVEWQEDLARTVAVNYYCYLLVYDLCNDVMFVGRSTDREVAVFVFVTLMRSAIKMADRLHKMKELVRHLTDEPINLKNFRESFFKGFVEGISTRLRKLRKETQQENAGMALVLSRSGEELAQWLEANKIQKTDKYARGTGGRINELGFKAGEMYAKEVELQTGVKGKEQKRLT